MKIQLTTEARRHGEKRDKAAYQTEHFQCSCITDIDQHIGEHPVGGIPVEIKHALSILTMLASGADPDTGEALLLSKNVTNALWQIVGFVEHKKSRAKALRPNCGKNWSPAEEGQLCREFERGMILDKMAEVHGRTRGGIIVRLALLGKIDLASTSKFGRWDASLNRDQQFQQIPPDRWPPTTSFYVPPKARRAK